MLSDRGRSFLSELMWRLVPPWLPAYLQEDGLVERFDWILTAMLLSTAESGERDWDPHHLPYILFAYRASLQESLISLRMAETQGCRAN